MRLLLASLCLLAGCLPMSAKPLAPSPPVTADALSWADIAARPKPEPGQRLAYGPDSLQFGHLRLPRGEGPFPVVMLIHGGCWLSAFDLGYFEHWSAWFAQRGYATWSIEYRRLGDEGGGWPGSFIDVAQATDYLRELARLFPLDLQRLTAVGHSAGGQLALWLAARDQQPPDSALFSHDPLIPDQVIGLAAITDLERYRVGPADSCHASVDRLLGGSPEQVPDRYALASPLRQLPLQAELGLISGDRDTIVDWGEVARYSDRASAANMRVVHWILPGAGHFDTAVPTAASEWAMCRLLGDCE